MNDINRYSDDYYDFHDSHDSDDSNDSYYSKYDEDQRNQVIKKESEYNYSKLVKELIDEFERIYDLLLRRSY